MPVAAMETLSVAKITDAVGSGQRLLHSGSWQRPEVLQPEAGFGEGSRAAGGRRRVLALMRAPVECCAAIRREPRAAPLAAEPDTSAIGLAAAACAIGAKRGCRGPLIADLAGAPPPGNVSAACGEAI